MRKREGIKVERRNTKCDCGHRLDEHYVLGMCDQCACTWWHPNVALVKRRQRQETKDREYYLVMRRYRAIERLKRMKRRRRQQWPRRTIPAHTH
jgi:hypothetical protein